MRIPVLFSFLLKSLNLDNICAICFWTISLNNLCSHQKSLTFTRSIVLIKKQKKQIFYLLTLHSSSFSFFFLFFWNKKGYFIIFTFFGKKEREQCREKWKCKPFTDFNRRDVFSAQRVTLIEGKPLKKKW